MRLSGGTIQHNQFTCGSRGDVITAIYNTLVACGWTDIEQSNSYLTGTFTGLPANGQTITIDGRTYTYKTTLASANDIKIGATADDCANNLVDAINDNEANEGVTYGTGTAVHDGVTAAKNGSGVVKLTDKTGGYHAFSVSEALNNFTFDVSTSRYGGYMLKCARTPAGLAAKVWLYDANDSYVWMRAEALDGTFTGQSMALTANNANLTLEIIACKYQFAIWQLQTVAQNCTEMLFTVPYLRPGNHPLKITAVANNDNKYEVTTEAAHGYASGQHIYIADVEGCAGINNRWEIDVTGGFSFILKGSSYSSGYVEETGLVGDERRICRLWFHQGQPNSGSNNRTLRSNFAGGNGTYGNERVSVCCNQFQYSNQSGSSSHQLILPRAALYTSYCVWSFGLLTDIIEARLGIYLPWGGPLWQVGDLWNAFITPQSVGRDVYLNDFGGMNWVQFGYYDSAGTPSYSGLWLARTAVEAE